MLDEDRQFVDRYNHELVEICRINTESFEPYKRHLRGIIQEFADRTQSEWGAHLVANFDDYLRSFWLVKPKAANLAVLLDSVRTRAA